MSLSFDATFYQSNRPDVYNAFIATAGSTGQTWAEFAQAHYNTFGRFEGSDPSASFSTTYYLTTYPDVAAAGVNPFDHFLANGALEMRQPYSDFPTSSFVPATYAAANPDLAAAGVTSDAALYQHWVIHGQFEGRSGAPAVDTPSNGQTFTLTTGVDTIAGTTNDDTINGYIDSVGTTDTLTAADSIDGGGGTDRFNITVDGNGAGALPGANITNVENFFIREVGGTAGTYDFGILSGEAQVWSDRSTDAVTFSNLATGTTVGLMGNGTTVLGNVTFGMATTTDDVSLSIADGVGASGAAPTVTAVGTATTANINSSGAPNTVGTVDIATASLTTVNVSASANLVGDFLSQATDQVGANGTVNVSGGAASVRFTAALDDTIATIDASGLTVGGLTAILNTNTALTVTGGTGADSFTTGSVLTTGSVNAGAGTDTLIQSATGHINSTTLGAKYTNFETLQANNGVTVDLDNYTGITAVNVLETGGGATVNDMTATQGGAVTLVGAANGTVALAIKGATGVGQLDTLAITVSDGDTTTSENIGAYTHTSLGIETLNFTATDDLNINSMAATTGVTALTVTGAGNASITTGAMAVSSNLGVDFSALTGANTFNAGAATGNAFAFTGGSGVDTITDNSVGGNVLKGGAGNDIVTLTDKLSGTAVTDVTGGAGADAITANMTGNATRDGMKFNFAAGDSVSDTSTTGISTTLTDSIANLDGATLGAAAGSSVEFDTEVAATAVTAGSTDVVLGTTTVTNGGDFFVNIENATTAYIYQDTDGDGIIEAGEFAIALTGIQTDTLLTGDFTVAGGDLILATT